MEQIISFFEILILILARSLDNLIVNLKFEVS
jgi:hypothetical protein